MPMKWIPRNISLWSNIAFSLAFVSNVLVILFYPFETGTKVLRESSIIFRKTVCVFVCLCLHACLHIYVFVCGFACLCLHVHACSNAGLHAIQLLNCRSIALYSSCMLCHNGYTLYVYATVRVYACLFT